MTTPNDTLTRDPDPWRCIDCGQAIDPHLWELGLCNTCREKRQRELFEQAKEAEG